MSLPDGEFDMLGEDELALLTKRFEKLHDNRVNTRRMTRTSFQCGKTRHFVTDCPEKMENKDGYKHRSRTNKHRSRCDQKHKHQNKDERGSMKKGGHGRKARAMVGASDVDFNSAYSSSSSSSNEDEGDRHKNKKASKTLSGSSCFVGDGFYGMARSSDARRVTRVTLIPTPRMRYVTSFPSCARRMIDLASCLITAMTCLERRRR
jgi:hypothetical protein